MKRKVAPGSVPTLTFVSGKGLDAARWATFRKGTAWLGRVQPGSTVSLSVRNRVVGTAKVDRIESGRAADIIRRYASLSHLEVDQVSQGDASRAVERCMKQYQRHYGRFGADDDTPLTVIVVNREPSKTD